MSDGATCEIWVGGESENPLYDGTPYQYCRLRREGTRSIGVGVRRIESPACVSLLTRVPDRAHYETALLRPVLERPESASISIDVEHCTEGTHLDGELFAVVQKIDVGGPACEVYLGSPEGPGRYCAFQRSAFRDDVEVVRDPANDVLSIAHPESCFLPDYDDTL